MWLMRRPKLALALALVGLLMLFAAQNGASVPVFFLFWGGELRVWALILATGAVGMLLGWLLREWRHKHVASKRSAAEREGVAAADSGGAQG